ncbi:hypothetical protein [Parvibaculum sp.]|uniref:hypothetical protein n=1 Tax=Parvibaculum sp. TaxID=2024848 RepID=UPI00320E1486
MTAPNRLDIQADEVNQAVDEKVRGVTVKVMLSPFDVPQSASAEFDKARRIIHLVFDYIGGDEPTVERFSDRGISLLVGKNSERLYGLDINVANFLPLLVGDKNKEIEFVINVAEELVTKYQEKNPQVRSKSFEAVNRVLKQYSSKITPILQQVMIGA